MKFIMKNEEARYLKGVIFGDSGSGKSTFAYNFMLESCRVRNLNKVLLLDLENGWAWIKKQNDYNKIQILEPEEGLNSKNYLSILKNIKELCDKQDISCLVIDSISTFGEIISDIVLEQARREVEKKGKHLDDLRYTDWSDIREKQEEVITILKNIKCDILLCGRATSDKEQENLRIINARSREVKGWKPITYLFDFSILAEVDIDITQSNIKTFNFLILKSRIANDGEKIKDINHWFDRIKIKTKEEIEQEVQEQNKKQELINEGFNLQKDLLENVQTLEELEGQKKGLALNKHLYSKEQIAILVNIYKKKEKMLK